MGKYPSIALAVLFVLVAAGCARQSLHEGADWRSDYTAAEVPANSGASAESDTTRFYEGQKSVHVAYDRGSCSLGPGCLDGETAVARGIYKFGMRSRPDYAGYFGAAFYLPSDFYSKQTGYVELLRWDNVDTLGDSADKGAIAIFADHRARLVRGPANAGEAGVQVIGGPFDIPTGQWADTYVHQLLRGASQPPPGDEGINEVYLNGQRVVNAGDVQNSEGNGYDRLLFGLVHNDATRPMTSFGFWFDRAYASNDRPPPPSRPNILFIVTDDQRSDGTLRSDVMPETLKWFRDGATGIDGGTQFDNAYVTSPLCCPSRSSIFSGLYAHNHGIRSNNETQSEHLDQQTTLQKYLKDDGYQTGIYGKYLNAWRLPRNPPYFDKWGTYEENPYGATADNPSGTFPVNQDGTMQSYNEYTVDYVDRKAQEFLQNAAADPTRPWFLYLAPNAPHEPASPPVRYSEANLPRSQLPDPPKDNSRNETDLSDKPPVVRTAQDTRQIFDQINPSTGQVAEGLSTKVARSLRSVDDLVRDVMEKLQALGEDQNTLAVFTSDNGYMWREHGVASSERYVDPQNPVPQPVGVGLSSKGHPYIEATKVPLFLRWPANPNVVKHFVDHRLVANIDLAPSVMDAIGVTPSQPMDGTSLIAPRAIGSEWRNRLLLEHIGAPGNIWASTVTTDYQYVEYYNADGISPLLDGGNPVREYYDLNSDPYEMTNLLQDGNPANDPNVSALSEQLKRDRFCVGSECPPGNGAPSDHSDPIARITTPGDGTHVSGTVPVHVDAYDNIAVDHVTFTADGNTMTDSTAPYDFSWTPNGTGQDTITATAYDVYGRASSASTVTVNVDGFGIQTVSNSNGRIEAGEKLVYSFPRPVDPSTLYPGWMALTPSDSRTVTVTVQGDNGGPPFMDDTMSVASPPSNALGTIDLGDWNYAAGPGLIINFTSSIMTMPNSRTVQVELRGANVAATLRTPPHLPMQWTMGNVRDTFGAPLCSAAPCRVVQSGSPLATAF
jgi:arylsulfatase A-like enzyme